MTQTTQLRSWATLSEAKKDLTINKPETEDTMSLLLTIYDNLNELHEMLSRLHYAVGRKIVEQNLYQKGGKK